MLNHVLALVVLAHVAAGQLFGCPSLLSLTATSGTIGSDYDGVGSTYYYSNSLSCRWDIQCPSGLVYITSIYMSTEFGYDYVRVYNSIGTLYFSQSGPYTRTSSLAIGSSGASVRFTTDSSGTGYGFTLSYTCSGSAVNTPAPASCGTAYCSTCSSLSGCGWCSYQSYCYSGDSSGPYSVASCGSWYYGYCPASTPSPPTTSCGTMAYCSTCTASSSCGWCGSRSTCYSGTSSGPYSVSGCGTWYWTSCSSGVAVPNSATPYSGVSVALPVNMVSLIDVLVVHGVLGTVGVVFLCLACIAKPVPW